MAARPWVYADAEELAWAAAALVVEEAKRSFEERGRFTIALAGGATPRRTYELLATPAFARLMPWEGAQVFFTDERCVDPSDPRSNEGMARAALLDHVPIPAEQIHPLRCAAGAPGGSGSRDPAADEAARAAAARRCAAEYEVLLREFFQADSAEGVAAPAGTPATTPLVTARTFDLVLLGLGEDGHTASLFPGSPALAAEREWVLPVFDGPDARAGVAESGAPATTPGLWRVTLTVPPINSASTVVFLVSGSAKAAATARVLREPAARVLQASASAGFLPAQLIHPQAGMLHWLLDDESAALLPAGAARAGAARTGAGSGRAGGR